MIYQTDAMATPDVVVVGGGFVGMAAAAALGDGRRRVVVLESRSGSDPRFRGELIHPHGVRVLAELGLYADLARSGGTPVEGFAVVPSPDAGALLLPYGTEGNFSERGLSMDHRAMLASLRAEVEARPGVAVRRGTHVVDVLRRNGRVIGVRTADGEDVFAELTVIADGRHSKIRGLVGIHADARLLSFTAALVVDVEVPHARHGHVFLGAPGPILAYAIGEGRTRMCVDLPASIDRGRGAIARTIADRYAPFVPEPLRGAMLRSAESGDMELCANHAIATRHCIAPGAALVGDAGGCCHPLTATGLTTGLNDVRALADELATAPTLDSALARYEKQRYRFVRAREVLAGALYDVFRAADDGAHALRDGLMQYWKRSARGRSASMALLSGEASGIAAFAVEYCRVVGWTEVGLLRGGIASAVVRPRWPRRVARMSSVARTSCETLGRGVATLYQDAAL